jgi:hypothetical protein
MWVKDIREQRPQEEKFVEEGEKREKTSKGRGSGKQLRGLSRVDILKSCRNFAELSVRCLARAGRDFSVSGLQNRV